VESCRGIVDREPDNAPARIELSRLLASEGTFEAAVGRASEAVRLAPDDPRAGEQLASIVADAGDAARLGPLPESLAARFPGRGGVRDAGPARLRPRGVRGVATREPPRRLHLRQRRPVLAPGQKSAGCRGLLRRGADIEPNLPSARAGLAQARAALDANPR